MRHINILENTFGAEKVLGGLCNIVATVEPDGMIYRMTLLHSITFGERNGRISPSVEAVSAVLKRITDERDILKKAAAYFAKLSD